MVHVCYHQASQELLGQHIHCQSHIKTMPMPMDNGQVVITGSQISKWNVLILRVSLPDRHFSSVVCTFIVKNMSKYNSLLESVRMQVTSVDILDCSSLLKQLIVTLP